MSAAEHWSEPLVSMGACSDAVAWARTRVTPQDAWRNCERGDWMLWLLGKKAGPVGSPSRKRLVLAACACARLALPYANGDQARIAIETAEAYARDEGATLEQVRKTAAAAYNVYAVAYAVAYADATYAAYAAAYDAAAHAAAYAAAAYAAYAAATAVTVADAATYAADAAAHDAAPMVKTETLARCADIVREPYPEAPELRVRTFWNGNAMRNIKAKGKIL